MAFFPQNRLNDVTAMFSTATHTILKGEGHDISLSESIHRNWLQNSEFISSATTGGSPGSG